jgi:uncharacterized protein (TIGR02271 family)
MRATLAPNDEHAHSDVRSSLTQPLTRKEFRTEHKDQAMHENIMPLSELSDYEVADDSVDVRGWTVTSNAGSDVGKVNDLLVDSTSMKARYLAVSLHEGASVSRSGHSTLPVLVPVDRAQIDEDDRRVVLDSSSEALMQMPRFDKLNVEREDSDQSRRSESAATSGMATAADSGARRITRSAEELRIGRRNVNAGEVTVRKRVDTQHVSEPVTRTREIVNVERRSVAPDAASTAEIRDEEIRVPVMEEEIVVEKRPVVKEELVITKDRVTETENVEAEVREERIEVDGADESRGHANRREVQR